MKKRVKRLSEQQKLSAEHPVIAKKIDESLKYSIKEGSCSSVMTGFGTSYLTPYALALNATSSQIGFLNGLISFLPSIVQLKASKLIKKFSRKKISVTFVLLQALMFIPIILALFLFIFNVPHTVWILIGFITLFYIFAALVHPAWFSWMGSLVPKNGRGKYFSKRNRIAEFFGLITMVLGAVILDYSKKLGFVLVGFGILFTLAMIFRIIAMKFLIKQYEPRLKIRKKDYFSLRQFLKRAPETPFGRFTIFTAAIRVATNIAGPFFAVYMLKDLGLSYIWFMAIVVSETLFQLFFYPILGKFSDRFGNIKLLRISCVSFSLTPLLWIVSKNPFYLLTVPAMIGGFAWAGFFLATNNYIYDSVRQEKRTYGLVYFNLLNGFGLFIGAGIGSLIALANITFMNKILFIFLISGIARLAVSLFASKILKEVRHVKKFTSQFIIREFQPARGIVREIHNLNHLTEKVEHYI